MAWQRAAELLQDREYEQVAQLLQEKQEAIQLAGQMNLVILLAAACQLCLTCRQFQADKELHELGLEEARCRERESRQQIQAVLTMLSQLTPLEAQVDLETASDLPIARPATEASEATESDKRPGLLQKIRQLLTSEPAATPAAAASLTDPDQQRTDRPASIDPEALPGHSGQSAASATEMGEDEALSDSSAHVLITEKEEVSELNDSSAGALAVEKEEVPKLSDGSADALAAEEEQSSELSDDSANQQTPEEDKDPELSGSSVIAHPAKPTGPALYSTIAQRQHPTTVEVSESNGPSLVVYCLGPFQTYVNERAIEKWRSGKGKSIFKYLVNNRQRPAPKEVLMDLFWPDVDPDAARNNLNVAIYGLREAFRYEDNGDTEFSHVLYRNETYLLNPELRVWLDVEAFLDRFQGAQQLERDGFTNEAVQEYHVAEALYQGEFLAEDRYEEWLMPQRRQLTGHYLELLGRLSRYYSDNKEYTSCITTCRSMLAIDPCLEDIHCRLMRCHYRQGQQHLALRQYHQCVNALKEELDITPGPKIEELYQMLRHHEAI